VVALAIEAQEVAIKARIGKHEGDAHLASRSEDEDAVSAAWSRLKPFGAPRSSQL
jgi:hypothetical protein